MRSIAKHGQPALAAWPRRSLLGRRGIRPLGHVREPCSVKSAPGSDDSCTDRSRRVVDSPQTQSICLQQSAAVSYIGFCASQSRLAITTVTRETPRASRGRAGGFPNAAKRRSPTGRAPSAGWACSGAPHRSAGPPARTSTRALCPRLALRCQFWQLLHRR